MGRKDRERLAAAEGVIETLSAEVSALKALHHPALAGDAAMEILTDDKGTVETVSLVDPWRKMVVREIALLRGAMEVQDKLIRRLISEVKDLKGEE